MELLPNTSMIEHDGEKVFVAVSPCSWMNKHYGLQVKISLKPDAVNAESEFVIDKTFDAHDMPRAETYRAGKALGEKWIAENGTALLHARVAEWAANAAKLNEELAKIDKREAAALKRRDSRYKRQGFTHRVTAWIHPEHGDDFQRIAYVQSAPTPLEIAGILKSSTVGDDYVVTAL